MHSPSENIACFPEKQSWSTFPLCPFFIQKKVLFTRDKGAGFEEMTSREIMFDWGDSGYPRGEVGVSNILQVTHKGTRLV